MSSALSVNTPPFAPLGNTDEMLFRQVHPDLRDGDQFASSVFLPNPSDNGQLSVDRSSLTTAKDAFDLYLTTNRLSVAVLGLTVGEFAEEKLLTFPDPIGPPGNAMNPAHARVDYNVITTKSQQKKAAKRLKQHAIQRGFLYQP